MRDTYRWRRALLGVGSLACLAAVACAVDLGTTARMPGFLEVEWEGETKDTIDALIDGVVIAQVRDLDGRPMSSRFIRFTALPLGDDNRPGVFLAPLGLTPSQPTAQVAANTAGIAIAAVRLGTLPGRAGIWVTVFELEDSDTVFVEVLPGSAHQIQLAPRDTTIEVGSSFQMRYALGDFYANPVEGAVSLTVGGAISLAGETVTGATVGTGLVFGVSGEVTDSVVVEVTAPSRGGS